MLNIFDIWTSVLQLIDYCQNKVSADQSSPASWPLKGSYVDLT